MKEIPQGIISEINDLLGIEGKLYLRLVDGQIEKTTSYQWSSFNSPLEIMSSISPELLHAIADASSQMPQSRINDFNVEKEMKSYFDIHFPELADEYKDYAVRMKEANDHFENLIGSERPEMPEVLHEPSERINEKIKKESNPDRFDMDFLQKRSEELWAEESEEIRAELKKYVDKLLAYNDLIQKEKTRRRENLEAVRKLLKGKPYRVYGYIVVAPLKSQYDILRQEKTNGDNYDIGTEDIIAALKGIKKRYGLDILNAGLDAVKFQLERPPSGEEAEDLIEELYQLCPDFEWEEKPDLDQPILLWWD
jgi:hypothetical protein